MNQTVWKVITPILCYVKFICVLLKQKKRILTIVSKNKELSQEEKDVIASKYGKIYYIGDNIGSNVGVLLNFA